LKTAKNQNGENRRGARGNTKEGKKKKKVDVSTTRKLLGNGGPPRGEKRVNKERK